MGRKNRRNISFNKNKLKKHKKYTRERDRNGPQRNNGRKAKKYREKYYNCNKYANNDEWQNNCIEAIKNIDNVILSSPTGSGKTRVYLEWAKQKGNKPVIITAPIKALANQQYRDLEKAGYTVGLETGDIKKVPENCDFICCTQEIYTNKYIYEKDVTVIMDEFHYIFEDNTRARAYIDALNNSKAKNILLCSATFGDIGKLVDYANKVSRRKFIAYESEARLTSLFFEGDIRKEDIKDALIVTFSKKNINKILQELKSNRKNKKKNKNEEITKLAQKRKIDNNDIINNAKKGLAGYYGALLPKEKMFIEECFEKKLIDTVVGTDALALGVNFPVEKVIFAQLTKFGNYGTVLPISKNLFEQLCGRAGRKGFFDNGKIYYCSDFARIAENTGYRTDKLYQILLEKSNEDMTIRLTPKIKELLLENTTIKKEVNFISKFSTEKIDKKEEYMEIEDTIDYILNKGFKIESEKLLNDFDDNTNYNENLLDNDNTNYNENLLDKEEEFIENIPDVYFDEYTPEMNCKMFTYILSGMSPKEIIKRVCGGKEFYDMLQFRKYVKALPKEYRRGLTIIDDIICEIDDTAIYEERGSVEVDGIVEQSEKEGRLNAENLKEVLKDQERILENTNEKRNNNSKKKINKNSEIKKITDIEIGD